jgi:hypothetical protein
MYFSITYIHIQTYKNTYIHVHTYTHIPTIYATSDPVPTILTYMGGNPNADLKRSEIEMTATFKNPERPVYV